jgi:hypothetical protein
MSDVSATIMRKTEKIASKIASIRCDLALVQYGGAANQGREIATGRPYPWRSIFRQKPAPDLIRQSGRRELSGIRRFAAENATKSSGAFQLGLICKVL